VSVGPTRSDNDDNSDDDDDDDDDDDEEEDGNDEDGNDYGFSSAASARASITRYDGRKQTKPKRPREKPAKRFIPWA